MYAIFDKFNCRRLPSIVLCSTSGEKLYTIPEAKNRKLFISLVELSEFTFEVPKTFEEDGTLTPYYNLLETRRVISLEGIGQFIITKVDTETDGIEEYKSVTCKGLEFEISSKNIDLLEATYSFYNPMETDKSLMNIILSYLPNWSIGEIDSELWNIKRYFDIETTNLYNFIIDTVQEAYDCVFTFDTFNRKIGAKKINNAISKTDIYMSYKNLVKQITITEDAENIYTALDVFGDSDLSIRPVNPLGGDTIYDFSYYANTSWMTEGLVKAVKAWETKKEEKKNIFKSLKLEYNTYNVELMSLEAEKVQLEMDYASLEHKLAIASAGEDSETCTKISSQMETKKQEIANKEQEIVNKEAQIENKNNQITEIQNSLSFESNFTESQIKELNYFIYKSKIQNTNYATTDDMTYQEKQEEVQNLYNYGETKLKQFSQPTYTCDIDSVNFLNLIEYEATIQEFELGAEITIEIDRDRDLFAKMVLLSYEMDLDDKTDLQLTFSNKLNFKSATFTYEDLFSKTSSISQAFDSDSYSWKLGKKAYDDFTQYKNNALNLLNQEIISSDNQEITINSNGIRGREWLEELKTFSGEQFWLNKNMLAFSEDGFKTTKTAFGKIILPDGSRAYGVIGDALVGNIVYTKYLTCQNENGSFSVDGSSVTIKNGNILMTTEEGESSLEDVLDDIKSKSSKDLADAILNITSDMGDMEEALKDGMVETFYQSTAPTEADGARVGDLWFNTDTGKLYRHNGSTSSPWVIIEDSKIQEAVNKAQNAQDTADGKITTFYCGYFPTKASHPNLDEGDLLIHKGQGNRQYRYDGSKWVDIQDEQIATLSSELADAVDSIYSDMNEKTQAIEDGMIEIFYQPRPPLNTDGKDGDLWYDTTVVGDTQKNEGYLKRNGVWVAIKDKGILDALNNAQNAQDTADGKITTFYDDDFPTITTHPTLSTGDLLIHSGQGNKQYRYNGKTWVNIQDTAINAISNELGEQVEAINTAMGNMQTAIEDGMIDIFYQGKQPSSAKIGDIWYDTSNKNKAYLYQSDGWKSIQDQNVLDALQNAQNAQDTADGKITSYYCSKADLPKAPSEGDLWFNINEKNKPYVYRGTTWVSAQDGSIEDAQNTANEALNKIESVTNSNGELITERLVGQILAGKNNIDCVDTTNTKALKLNEVGLLISNTKTNGDWNWKTAITADGIVADAIKANGTISGVNLLGGTLNIGSGAFKVDSSGNVTVTKGTIDLGSGAFSVASDGSVGISKGTLNLGSGAFKVNSSGDVTITKGSIDIGSGAFTVDSSGNVVATSMRLTGASVTNSTITGGSININNGAFKVDTSGNVTTAGSLTLGGNINMTGSIKWSTSSSPVKAQYSVDGSSSWHTDVTSSDKYVKYSYDGGTTWTSAIKIVGENGINGTNGVDGKDGKDGLDAKLPEFITETYIDATKVESPIFRGGLIEGCTLRARGTSKSAIEVYNASGTRAGYIKYDDNGNGSTEGANRMYINTENGYNMKLQSSANMSLSASKIYLEGTVIINGMEISSSNVAVFG